MSIVRDQFAVDVYYKDKLYTPQQVVDYISNTSGEGFADEQQIDSLKKQSTAQAQSVVDAHKLTMDQMLQRSTSDAGKSLSDLTLQHCDAVIGLIQEGGWRRGILI